MKPLICFLFGLFIVGQSYAQLVINNPRVDLNAEPANLAITRIEFSEKRVEVFYRYKFKRGTKESYDSVCLHSPGKKKSLRIYDNDGNLIATLVSTKNISNDCVWGGTKGPRGQTLDFSASFTPIENLSTNKIDIIAGDIQGKKGSMSLYGIDVSAARRK